MEVFMRYFLSVLLTIAFFMLSAQEPQLVPIAPKPVKKAKRRKRKILLMIIRSFTKNI